LKIASQIAKLPTNSSVGKTASTVGDKEVLRVGEKLSTPLIVSLQLDQRCRMQWNESALLVLALPDKQNLTVPIEIANSQGQRFGNTQSGASE
jgi:hypothetical protein